MEYVYVAHFCNRFQQHANHYRSVSVCLTSVDSQSITLMIAGVVMIIIPSISIFIIGQKQLIRGMFFRAVKG